LNFVKFVFVIVLFTNNDLCIMHHLANCFTVYLAYYVYVKIGSFRILKNDFKNSNTNRLLAESRTMSLSLRRFTELPEFKCSVVLKQLWSPQDKTANANTVFNCTEEKRTERHLSLVSETSSILIYEYQFEVATFFVKENSETEAVFIEDWN
jgi:hypothetical protein